MTLYAPMCPICRRYPAVEFKAPLEPMPVYGPCPKCYAGRAALASADQYKQALEEIVTGPLHPSVAVSIARRALNGEP